jgi:aryl-alcohol dehydrogenase-like predicted oxidoreductase
MGYTFFDTAYGNGQSEALLGRTLRQARSTHAVFIASRVGEHSLEDARQNSFAPGAIACALESSLRRLGRDYIDLYQLHHPPPGVLAQGAAFEALERLKQAGKIRHYGVAIQAPADGLACLELGSVETLQLAYNLFSRLEPPEPPKALFRRALSQGVGLIAREPLAAGYLSGQHALSGCYGQGDSRANAPLQRRRMLMALGSALGRLEPPGVSLAQAALRFVLDQPCISTTVVGIRTPEQALLNARATELPSFAELERTALAGA